MYFLSSKKTLQSILVLMYFDDKPLKYKVARSMKHEKAPLFMPLSKKSGT